MSILEMSKAASSMIVIIVIIRALAINKLPKRTFLALWCLALLRLLVPLAIPSDMSLASIVAWLDGLLAGLSPASSAVGQAAATPAPITTALPAAKQAVLYLPPIAVPLTGVKLPVKGIDWPFWIWLAVAVGIACYFVMTHLRAHRKFRTSLPVEDTSVTEWLYANRLRRRIRVRRTDQTGSPLTYGIFRPVILLPKAALRLPMEELQYILAHEHTHIRRFDAVNKLLLAMAVCVHWFNPLVWVFYVLANRDIELACDEAVVHKLGESMKSSYALTLIGMEEKRSCPTPLYSSFSKYAIEERINAIMKMRRKSILGTLLALVLVLGMTVVFATSAGAAMPDAGDVNITAAVDSIIIRENAMDGSVSFSTDGGDTWTMAAHAVTVADAVSDYYTYDEYKAWLEDEKIALQSYVGTGEMASTPTAGTFAWTQEMVDAVIGQYEDQLEQIRQGALVSKYAHSNVAVPRAVSGVPSVISVTAVEAAELLDTASFSITAEPVQEAVYSVTAESRPAAAVTRSYPTAGVVAAEATVQDYAVETAPAAIGRARGTSSLAPVHRSTATDSVSFTIDAEPVAALTDGETVYTYSITSTPAAYETGEASVLIVSALDSTAEYIPPMGDVTPGDVAYAIEVTPAYQVTDSNAAYIATSHHRYGTTQGSDVYVTREMPHAIAITRDATSGASIVAAQEIVPSNDVTITTTHRGSHGGEWAQVTRPSQDAQVVTRTQHCPAMRGYAAVEAVPAEPMTTYSITTSDEEAAISQADTQVTVRRAAQLRPAKESGATGEQFSARIDMGGKITMDIGPFDTEEALRDAISAFCAAQINAGLMTQTQADEIVAEYK